MSNILFNTNITANNQEEEVRLSNVQNLNAYIAKDLIQEVHEAIKYFSKRFRATEDNPNDEFVLMTKEQVDMFDKLNTNPEVKIKVEWEDKKQTKIWCYILYRNHPKKKH